MDLNTASVPHQNDIPRFGYYNSREELESFIHCWAFIRGYKFIIRRSCFDSRYNRRTIAWSCNRFRFGCQFSIIAKDEDRDIWLLKPRDYQYHKHNHEPVKQLVQQPTKQKDIHLNNQPTIQDEQQDRQQDGQPDDRILAVKLPTCSKCHKEGHRRGAKCCPLKDLSTIL